MGKPMMEYLNQHPPCIQMPCTMDNREALNLEGWSPSEVRLNLIPLENGWVPYSVVVPVAHLRRALRKLAAVERRRALALRLRSLAAKLNAWMKGEAVNG